MTPDQSTKGRNAHESSTGDGEGEALADVDRVHTPVGWSSGPPADDLRERRVWTCKIGGRVGRLPGGADAPLRRAVADAFTAETGCPVEFCFSGWGDDLDESELAVVEDRAPDPEVIRAALVKRLTALPPEPPAPVTGEDLRERIARAIYEDDERAKRDELDNWGAKPLTDHEVYLANADAVLAVLPHLLAPSPVPPWPGAVLSGLCDEDGVPTWLTRAGQVPVGVELRTCTDLGWVENRGVFTDTAWVEVRAPGAVPELETERVSAFDAVLGSRRIRVTGKYVVTCNCLRVVDDGEVWVGEFGIGYAVVAPDGTVEVLKDGDR